MRRLARAGSDRAAGSWQCEEQVVVNRVSKWFGTSARDCRDGVRREIGLSVTMISSDESPSIKRVDFRDQGEHASPATSSSGGRHPTCADRKGLDQSGKSAGRHALDLDISCLMASRGMLTPTRRPTRNWSGSPNSSGSYPSACLDLINMFRHRQMPRAKLQPKNCEIIPGNRSACRITPQLAERRRWWMTYWTEGSVWVRSSR